MALTAAAVPAALLLEPMRETLSFGQINLWLMALVVFDCLTRTRWWPRGVLVDLAIAIKLTPPCSCCSSSCAKTFVPRRWPAPAPRVAPVALCGLDLDRTLEWARRCARATQAHPVDQAGAALQAAAVLLAVTSDPASQLDPPAFLGRRRSATGIPR